MSKYIFTDENFKPICIAFYQDDTIAEKEGIKLAQEMSQNINVCKVVFQSHTPGQYKQARGALSGLTQRAPDLGDSPAKKRVSKSSKSSVKKVGSRPAPSG